MKNERYIPALAFGFLDPLYDITMLFMRESAFKKRLVKQAGILKGRRVLDLGCGTATLTMMMKRAQPDAKIVGLDGDPKILEIAKSKIEKGGLDIPLNLGMAFKLPYKNNFFDRVVSSLVIHHLTRENKIRTFAEIFRVLKPGGELHVADFGKPNNPLMHLISLVMRNFEETKEGIAGQLPGMLGNAGFEKAEETARYSTVFGTLSLYRAKKPSLRQRRLTKQTPKWGIP